MSGILHSDFTLDKNRTAALVEASRGMSFTFHRAFDWVKDPMRTLEGLKDLEVDCVLTSGQQKSAELGLSLLRELKDCVPDILVMPGSGINLGNVQKFKEQGFGAVHLSGTQFYRSLTEVPPISMNSPSFLNDDQIGVSGLEILKAVVNKVK